MQEFSFFYITRDEVCYNTTLFTQQLTCKQCKQTVNFILQDLVRIFVNASITIFNLHRSQTKLEDLDVKKGILDMIIYLGIFHQRNKVLCVHCVMKTHFWQPGEHLKMVFDFLVLTVMPNS